MTRRYTDTPRRRPLRLTKTQQRAIDRLQRHAERLGEHAPLDWDVSQIVPEAWATIEEDFEVHEPKVKITLRLDESIAKFFRAQGHGYQTRINHILGTYAQMKIAEVNITNRKLDAFNEALSRGATMDEAMEVWKRTE
ncbi:BrnA antitoxin family protein [Celeribacter sp.]|uniref:BrnA antitoxin family protein n=1 Tax=Celeribacter sp. TaxID=1890673 RepID=UPI003A8D07D0